MENARYFFGLTPWLLLLQFAAAVFLTTNLWRLIRKMEPADALPTKSDVQFMKALLAAFCLYFLVVSYLSLYTTFPLMYAPKLAFWAFCFVVGYYLSSKQIGILQQRFLGLGIMLWVISESIRSYLAGGFWDAQSDWIASVGTFVYEFVRGF